MSKHICIYSDDPDKGGVAQYNHRIALALVGLGYRVSMVQTRSVHPMVATREAAGVRHWWLPFDTGAEFIRTITETADAEKAFAESSPDLVVFSDCCPVSNIAAKQAAIRRGVPFVVVVGFVAAYLAERFGNCLRVLAQQYAQAREVVAVSTENLGQLRRLFGLPPDKGRVVFYGVPPKFYQARSMALREEMRARLGIANDALVSLTAARLSSVKLHMLQLASMEYLKKVAPKVRVVCVWVGDGELRAALEAEISKKGLKENFRLVGQQADVEPWYDMADTFALTSESEGMPISIMEAMAKGLPVVATAVSGIPEELGNAGVLLPDPTKDAARAAIQLAETWLAWSRKTGLREEVGLRCKQRAEALFKEEMMMRKTQVVLEEAMAAEPVNLA